jgi:hypothetical protein
MAIIINELEVVIEAPSAPTGGTAAAPGPPATQQMQPIDVRDISEREARAEWRLMAH